MDKYSMKNIELNHGGSTIDIKDTERVDHPKHYNSGNIEVIDYIEDQKLGFCLGNAIKYISRAGKKDSALDAKTKEIEDLEKAIWYINRRIVEIEKDLCS